jgi:hypothetical protein
MANSLKVKEEQLALDYHIHKDSASSPSEALLIPINNNENNDNCKGKLSGDGKTVEKKAFHVTDVMGFLYCPCLKRKNVKKLQTEWPGYVDKINTNTDVTTLVSSVEEIHLLKDIVLNHQCFKDYDKNKVKSNQLGSDIEMRETESKSKLKDPSETSVPRFYVFNEPTNNESMNQQELLGKVRSLAKEEDDLSEGERNKMNHSPGLNSQRLDEISLNTNKSKKINTEKFAHTQANKNDDDELNKILHLTEEKNASFIGTPQKNRSIQ